MKRPSRLVVAVVGALALAAAVVVSGQRDDFDEWRQAAGGHDTTRIAAFRLAGGRYEFRAHLDDDGTPNVVYFTPGHGGGARLTFVGERGGWAVEPRVMHAGDRDIVYGATIADAAAVQVVTGDTAKTTATRLAAGNTFRYFVLVTDAGQRVQRTHDVTALDRDGNLLGRAHDNYGSEGAPDLGAYDGLWDRRYVPPFLD